MQFRRGLATLACQCVELAELNRLDDAHLLHDSFREPLADSWLDTGQRAAVLLTLELADQQGPVAQLSAALAGHGLVTAEEMTAVRAIYCFDVPNLREFRQQILRTDG